MLDNSVFQNINFKSIALLAEKHSMEDLIDWEKQTRGIKKYCKLHAKIKNAIWRKEEWIFRQMSLAIKEGMIPLRNGSKIPLRLTYRCLYCGEWFSQVGAEKHFGKTRMEYHKKKLTGKDSGIEIEI